MKKVLIANRGEIALRVMRSLKEMGLQTVAVYSDVDRTAPHVLFADEAVHLGPSPSAQSYLRADKIIEACKNLNVDAIHPGFGFLSENAGFANKLEKEGIIFIGPSAHSIDIMGSKLAAKAAVADYDIPMIPGTDKAIEDPQIAKGIAKDIGFPILIKASAGGGGKGMRVVEHEAELEEQMNRAIGEAKSAFGDGSVFIEKYLTTPRHIEIQILADQHGNYVHLFERECSIQRRHQKVIEEAPFAKMTDSLRERMGAAALNVARSCKYFGVGTVEFLLDGDDFYFLEMNTRLQVEHSVTEMITGIDLVKEQVKVARGEKLGFSQSDLQINGHAIELRVYAEDPLNNFLPDIGRLDVYQIPEGEGIRVDDGLREGMDIPIYYDPMIAKLIVHAKDRDAAIQLMRKAIAQYKIKGVKTTLAFGDWVMQHPLWKSAELDTNFIKKHFSTEILVKSLDAEQKIAAELATMLYLKKTDSRKTNSQSDSRALSAWRQRP